MFLCFYVFGNAPLEHSRKHKNIKTYKFWIRSGSGATKGVVTISWRHQRTRGGGVYKAGGTSKQ
jgi:hypothetical protein